VLRSVASRSLVKTENPSACATVNWKVSKWAIELYLSLIKRTCNRSANKFNHPNKNTLFSSRVPHTRDIIIGLRFFSVLQHLVFTTIYIQLRAFNSNISFLMSLLFLDFAGSRPCLRLTNRFYMFSLFTPGHYSACVRKLLFLQDLRFSERWSWKVPFSET
jgi:hypothetical protein